VDNYAPTLGFLPIFIKFEVFLRLPLAFDVYGFFARAGDFNPNQSLKPALMPPH
jgi:hypothetical protein